MSTWTDIVQLDVPDVELDITRCAIRGVDLPVAVLPRIGRMIDLVDAAAYAGVGAAGVTIMKLDEHRRELTDQVTARIRALVDVVA